MGVHILSKPVGYGIGLMLIATSGGVGYALRQPVSIPAAEEQAAISAPQIVALGRLEPVSEVISLSAPLALADDRIAELRVKAGDSVAAGQVIAVLDSRDRLEKLLTQAQAQVQVANRQLAQAKASAKQGEISAQRANVTQLQAELSGEMAAQAATLARLQAESRNAQSEFARFESLYQSGAISASDREAKRLTLETAQAQLAEAKANQNRTLNTRQAQVKSAQAALSQLTEVRPEDVAVAQAEVTQATTAVKVAAADLAQAFVRAPAAGEVIKVLTRPGEKTNGGIVELGQTQQMIAIAEVDESDIQRIRPGQSATITGDAFSGELNGSVSELGQEVIKQSTFSNQPGTNLDSRVVEVRIVLTPHSSQQVRHLTNLQVQVAIRPS